jgi:ABC-type Fe3+ transport system permease subunit
MIRVIIENFLLLLLPTLLYIAYIFLTGKKKGKGRQVLDDAPLLWLFLAGIAMAIGVLAVFGTVSQDGPGQAYRPPEFRDGKIIPGRIEKKAPSDDG